MEARELFIYNETYPLPLDKYTEFKSRRDGCAGNPMCINRLKYDAETFIADFGKKHGSKIETGEESGFTILKDDINLPKSVSDIKENKNFELIVLVILVALAVFAFIKKSMAVGTVVILALLFLPAIMPSKDSQKE